MYHLLQEGTGDTAVKVVSDIIEIAKGAKQADGGHDSHGNSLKTYSYSSIASAASKLIAVFPLLMSKTVSPDTAQMVSKYIEQKGCILLQIALQQANISSAKNGIEYFKNFHQNLDLGGGTLNTLSDTVEAWAKAVSHQDNSGNNNTYTGTNESSSISMQMYEERLYDFPYDETYLKESDDITISPVLMKQLLDVMKENENVTFYDTKLNPISIDDYVVKEGFGDYHVTLLKPIDEASDPNKPSSRQIKNLRRIKTDRELRMRQEQRAKKDELARRKEQERSEEARKKKEQREDEKYEREKQKYEDYKDDRRKKQERDDEEYAHKQEKYRREEEEYLRQQARDEEQETKYTRNTRIEQIKDQDIKKMNNAVPSILVVRFYNNTNATVATEFIIGVKAKVLGVNSDEILRRIANDNKDGRFFLNLMRTLTGELKKSDFLFGLSRIDEDLRSSKKKGSQGDLWKLLQNRAMAAKQAVKSNSVNNYSAITTVVISQEDADELYKEENLDMNNPGVARHFMKSYNLLAFVICDDSTESMKVLFDDDDKYFEELSYKMLERETQDGTYKKLINLMASSR